LEDVPVKDVATAVCAAFGDKEPTVLEGKSSYNTFFLCRPTWLSLKLK